MLDAICLDQYGNTIYHLTQWDYNQKLIVDINGFDFSDIPAPIVHFCNINSNDALSVQSIIQENKIVADIPNILLKEPYQITAYLYLMDNNSGKTIYTIEIPVRKRPKPSDYEYEDNVEVVLLSELIQQVKELNENVTNAENERNSNEQIRISSEKVRENNETNRINNEAIRVQNENERINNEIDRENRVNEIVDVAEKATEKTLEATANAVAATGNANATAAEILERANSGEFNGAPGKDGKDGKDGDKGDKGDSGVLINPGTAFYIYTDNEDNSAIHLVYDDSVGRPPIYYNEETGELKYRLEY